MNIDFSDSINPQTSILNISALFSYPSRFANQEKVGMASLIYILLQQKTTRNQNQIKKMIIQQICSFLLDRIAFLSQIDSADR